MTLEAEANSPFHPLKESKPKMNNQPTIDYRNYMNAQSEWAQAFMNLAQQSEEEHAIELSSAAGDALKRVASKFFIR